MYVICMYLCIYASISLCLCVSMYHYVSMSTYKGFRFVGSWYVHLPTFGTHVASLCRVGAA